MQTAIGRLSANVSDWTASITYRSEAARPTSTTELEALMSSARRRNRQAGVTGMLLYDGGRFLQTLEGPPEALDEIWSAIQNDPRHVNIEVLSQQIVSARLFSQWDMRLFCRDDGLAAREFTDTATATPLAEHLPELKRLALAADERAVCTMIDGLVASGWTAETLIKRLLEPVARGLGDAWLADDCSEFDLTIALGVLQLAGHGLHDGAVPAGQRRRKRYGILLVPAPGEPHMLGASLMSELFNRAGWAVNIEFPDNDADLVDLIIQQRPDAIDIGLSDAIPRHHAIARLRETVAKCRIALPNQALVISVGGRIFSEAAAAASNVGADHARVSAAEAVVKLSRLVGHNTIRNAQAAR